MENNETPTETPATTNSPQTTGLNPTTSSTVATRPTYGMGNRFSRMGMGMGGYGGMGMGMGMGGYGRMGMGMNPGGPPNGFQQQYQGFFAGLRNVLQMSFSGISLYMYGKIFGSMMIKVIKFLAKKLLDGGRWLLAVFLFNRHATKILNGVVKQAKESGSSTDLARAMFRGLLLLGLLGLAVLFFMMRGTNMEEEETRLLSAVRARKARREAEMSKLEQCKPLGTPNILRL
jgi:hypothetical protein